MDSIKLLPKRKTVPKNKFEYGFILYIVRLLNRFESFLQVENNIVDMLRAY